MDFLVIPADAPAEITFLATIGDKQYSASVTPTEALAQGLIHTYTLTLSAEGMKVSTVEVTPWGEGQTGSNELKPAPLKIKSAGKSNGVYVITAKGELKSYETQDNTGIGVAVITDNQRIMIEKNGTNNTDIIKAAYAADGVTNTNTEYTNFAWGMDGTDITGIANITDETTALADFNGKAYTPLIIAAPDTDTHTDLGNIGTYCAKFNEMNGSFTDWYIPACGQLKEIRTNKYAVNVALRNIGGYKFQDWTYWSSTECDENSAWAVDFGNDNKAFKYTKWCNARVRFVRNIP